jgi:GT2 family glycosyltransferase
VSPSGAQWPSVGAVVVNFNGADRILRCLRALERQERRPDPIVVVDNGSSDGSPERIREAFPGVELLDLGHNRGLSAARNAGLRRLSTDLVLSVDADVYLEPDCLRRLATTFERERPAVVCPRIRLLPEREVVQADGAEVHFAGTMILRHGYRAAAGTDAETTDVGACPGGCLLADRRVLLDAGAFDELFFFYFEDLELSLRLRGRGLRLLCEPAAVVFHDRGAGTPGLAFRGRGPYPGRRAYLTVRHRLLILLTHYRWRTLVVLAPALALYETASLIKSLIEGWAIEWARAWLWVLGHPRAVRQRRLGAHAARKLRDRELFVGGPLPLAPGLLRTRSARVAVGALSAVLDGYWRLVRRWIG